MKNIRNCKIRVLNVEHSKAIQEKALEMGFSWPGNRKVVTHCDKQVLVFYSDLICWGDDCDFSAQENKEIFFYNGEFHHEPEPQETNADIKTHPIFDNGFQYGEVVYFSGVDGYSKATYLAPDLGSELSSVVEFYDSGVIAAVHNSHLEKQSDYEERKNLENLSAKIANLFAASVETVYLKEKFVDDKVVFLEFTKRLKSEDLLPF